MRCQHDAFRHPYALINVYMRILLFLYACLLAPAPEAAPVLEGIWQLNVDASTDPEDAFDGKLRKESYPVPYTPSPRGQETARDATQESYWEMVRNGKERGSLKNLRRLGTAYPLVKAERLEIQVENPGYQITYDGELPRAIRPSANGRVFSAKGDELVSDTFGYTLAYWDKETLVLEADAPDGGKVIERLTAQDNPRQLEYVIQLDLRLLEEPVELKRLFVPVVAAVKK